MRTFCTLLLIMSASMAWSQKSFDRADFYINTNECINCHIFLPNYAIALENSDTMYIHLDNETKRFGIKYLESKGIKVSKFDSVFYENLLDKYDGYFDSFIVLTNDGNKDTILVKTPLIFQEEVKNDNNPSEDLNCGETSNRVTSFIGEQTFILKDYLLGRSFKYSTLSNQIINCDSDPFQVENYMEKYYDFVSSKGISTDLTRTLNPLLVQLNKDKPQVYSTSINESDLSIACVQLPYVYTLANGDTAISEILLLQSSKDRILGILKDSPSAPANDSSIGSYYPSLNNGFIYSQGKLITEFKKPKSDTTFDNQKKFIGIMELDSNGYFVFQEIFDLKSPSEFDKSTSLRFHENIVYFSYAPIFFDCEDWQNYQLPIATDSLSRIELYSVTKSPDSNNTEFQIVYRINTDLHISIFYPQTNKLIEQKQVPINKSQYAISQKEGVFILSEGGPSLPYQFISYSEK